MVPLALAGGWIVKKATGVFAGIMKFFASLSLRQWILIGGLLLFAFAQYSFFNYAVDKGHKEGVAAQKKLDEPIIAQLTKERDDAVDKYKAYRTGFINWVRATNSANEAFKKENQAKVAELEERLKSFEEKKSKQKKELIREIPKFIPVGSLRDYDLPLGFVRLFDISLEGEGAEGTSDGFLSGSIGIDVEAPSGIKLSEATAEVFIPNNTECVVRGEVIRAWQDWYPSMRKAYEKAVKTQVDTAPEELPPPPHADLLDPTGGSLPPIAQVDTTAVPLTPDG